MTLNRYILENMYKEEVNAYVNMVKKNCGLLQDNILNSFTKNFIFLNSIFRNMKQDSYYYTVFITDTLETIHSLSGNSEKIFNFYYRSLIENILRVLLEYESSNDTGVLKLFADFEEKYGENIKNNLYAEYGKCCNVVHSNIAAKINIYECYEEILSVNELTNDKKNQLLKRIDALFKFLRDYIVVSMPDTVHNTFYNKNETLYYLIGKEAYVKFENSRM